MHEEMLKTSTAQLDQDEISMQTSSRCDETRGDELVGRSVDWMGGVSDGNKRKIWYLLTYIERNSIPVSSSIVSKYTPIFAILGIGIPTFGERRGFCFRNFQLRRLVLLLAFLLD